MLLQFLLRIKLMSVMDTIIRVPAVFVMDALMNNSSFGPWTLFVDNPAALQREETRGGGGEEEGGKSLGFEDGIVELTQGQIWTLTSLNSVFLRLLGFMIAFVIFLLPTWRLVQTYKWLVSVGSLFGCLWANSLFLNHGKLREEELIIADNYLNFGAHFFVLSLFSLVFTCTHNGLRTPLIQRLLTIALVAPSFLNLNIGPVSQYWTELVPIVSVSIAALYVLVSTVLLVPRLYVVLQQSLVMTGLIVRHNGLHILLENEWLRLRVPNVLRLFWLIRFGEHLLFLRGQLPESEWASSPPMVEDLVNVSKRLLVSGCDTLVAVLGMTSVVASITHYLCTAVQQFLMTDDGEEKSFGTVSAILFLILALQTGLTGLDPEKRLVRLCRNFCLLFTAVLHFIHTIVSPILMSLSASRNRSVKHHTRALLVCGILIITPSWLLVYLWSTHTISTWLLAVTAFSIEVIIKVIISLLIYMLFIIDAYRNTFWEKLDDYVYYVRATGNTIEFIFGIFLFFNGTWILVFEAGGTIRACLMCIHAYFNIWMQAKAGWKVFVRRRTAVNKINSFPEASSEQLQRLDDVCAICYQEMSTARITVCKHFFHALCLRKWLYIQDRCPMCHKALYEIENEAGTEADPLNAANVNHLMNANDASPQQLRPNRAEEQIMNE